jgi:hypothetical protein
MDSWCWTCKSEWLNWSKLQTEWMKSLFRGAVDVQPSAGPEEMADVALTSGYSTQPVCHSASATATSLSTEHLSATCYGPIIGAATRDHVICSWILDYKKGKPCLIWSLSPLSNRRILLCRFYLCWCGPCKIHKAEGESPQKKSSVNITWILSLK